MKKYFISYPIIFLAIVITVLTMMLYYSIENWFIVIFAEDTYFHLILRFVPSTVYSLVVMIYGIIYGIVAVKLTNWG
jgi:hypothetical protein